MKLDKNGQSTLLLALFLGVMVALIGADLTSRLRDASRLEYNLRQRNNTWQYSIQISQIVAQAYQLGTTYGATCNGQNPCPLTQQISDQDQSASTFSLVSLIGAGGTPYYLLFPLVQSGAQGNPLCVDSYCIAVNPNASNQPIVTALNNEEFHAPYDDSNYYYRASSPIRGIAAFFPFEAIAEAGSSTASPLPAPYLSPLPNVVPTNAIDVSKCDSVTGPVTATSACIVCSDGAPAVSNADCATVRICVNGSTYCPDPTTPNPSTPLPYIQPRFAFVKPGY